MNRSCFDLIIHIWAFIVGTTSPCFPEPAVNDCELFHSIPHDHRIGMGNTLLH